MKQKRSIMKLQEVSRSSSKLQEQLGRQNITIIINKQTKYSDSERHKQTLKISTVKKHFQLITLLIKAC